jgi:hypothetical protein
VHIFGVRHLSPGGAKHLLDYLDELQPTAVLIEGPADATAEIRHLTNKETKPPVAVLAFTADLPIRTALWPFAVYSPELQGLQWAEANGAMASFIDLPSSVILALQDTSRLSAGLEHDRAPDSGEAGEPAALESDPEKGTEERRAHGDDSPSLYSRIASVAGEHDYDMYWERNYEHNANPGAYREAILSFSAEMRDLSEGQEQREQPVEHAYNYVREAYMRRQIGKKIAAGHRPERIVVICGAYHAAACPALRMS